MDEIKTVNSWDEDQITTEEQGPPSPPGAEPARVVKVWNYSAKRSQDQPVLTINPIG